MTHVHPAAKAALSLVIKIGKAAFQGIMIAAGPTGSERIRAVPSVVLRFFSNSKVRARPVNYLNRAIASGASRLARATGAPTCAVQSFAKRDTRRSSASANVVIIAARSLGCVLGHGPCSKAFDADAIARSISSAVAIGTSASVLRSARLTIFFRSDPEALTQCPPTKKLSSMRGGHSWAKSIIAVSTSSARTMHPRR